MSRFNGFVPVVLFFVISTALLILGNSQLQEWGVDQAVILAGNTLLFLITLVSFSLAVRGLANPNPHAFVRSVYGSIMIKLFACMIAAFVYISIKKTGLNKPALFTCMGLYLVYTFMEVSLLMKMLKRKPHA